MTRDETKTVLAMLASVYPANLLPAVNEKTVNVWYQMLADLEYTPVQYSVAAWLQTSKYPPTIADIREKVTAVDCLSPEEAWSKVHEAIRRFLYPEDAKDFLGDLWPLVQNWRYYSTLLTEDIPNDKARFIKMYTAHIHRAKYMAQISAPVREALTSGQKQIGDGK